MSRLFRSATPGLTDYAALGLVLAVFLAVIGLMLVPQNLLSSRQAHAAAPFQP